MKQKSLLKVFFLLCALIVGSTSVWAATSTVTASKISSASVQWKGSANETWNVSVTGGATDQNVTSGYAQVGTKNSPSTSITFSTSGISGTITSIVIDCASYSGLATVSCTVGGNNFGTQNQSTPSWSNNTGGDITFSGSASGTIVVTMTNGNSGRAMYVESITVTYSSGPSISASDKNIAFDATSGEFSYTLNNPVDDGELSADDNVDWISNVAVNTGTNKVTFNTEANSNPTPRVGTITMTYKKGNETLATKEVTITQAKAVVMLNYSLATQVVPGRHYIITSGKSGDVKAMGEQATNNRSEVAVTVNAGEISIESDAGVYEFVIAGDVTTGYYTIYDTENAGYLYAASSSNNQLKVQKVLNDNGKWTIDIDNDGVATIKAKGTNSRNWMRYNSGGPWFSCYGSGQDNIYLFERDGDTSVQEFPVTITAAKYATFASYFDLDFSGVSGLYAYTATVSGTELTFNKVTKAKGGEGLLLYADVNEPTIFNVPVATDSPVAVSGNKLVRGTGAAVASAGDNSGEYNYVLSNNGGVINFYLANGKTVDTNKAYLKNINPTAVSAKFFLPTGEEETDGINAVSTAVENGVRYNLAGQRVGNDYKGIVIVNGKKVIRK